MVGLDTIHGQCLSGDQIEKLPEHQLEQIVNNVVVFYRVTPRHKLNIVKVSTDEIQGNRVKDHVVLSHWNSSRVPSTKLKKKVQGQTLISLGDFLKFPQILLKFNPIFTHYTKVYQNF